MDHDSQQQVQAKGKSGRVLELLATTGLGANVGFVLWRLPRLPSRVPTHFGFGGQVNGWGSKWALVSIPLIGFGLLVMLRIVARLPVRMYNFPWAVTEDSIDRQYRNARLMVRSLNALIAWSMAAVSWDVTSRAAGGSGLGVWLMPAMLTALAVLIGAFIYRGWRLR